MAVAGYLLIVAAMLARVIASLAAVGRLRRAATSVDDPAWLSALERCRRKLGIGRQVGLAWSPRTGIPVVFGWLRPIVLLPDSLAGREPGGLADAILLHELSHVRRGDYPWNVALRLVQAIYWPHPLVWLLGRTIAEGRERSCDAVCVHELGDASYGETLLAVAAGVPRRSSPAIGLAMARTSGLGRRLARIATGRGEAHPLPRPTVRVLIVGIALFAAGMVGAVRFTRAAAIAVPAATVADDSPDRQAPANSERTGLPPPGRRRRDRQARRECPGAGLDRDG